MCVGGGGGGGGEGGEERGGKGITRDFTLIKILNDVKI